jgi:hypothetical protein
MTPNLKHSEGTVMPPEEDSRTPLAELEKAIKRRIVERTGGRIRTLEIEVSDSQV